MRTYIQEQLRFILVIALLVGGFAAFVVLSPSRANNDLAAAGNVTSNSKPPTTVQDAHLSKGTGKAKVTLVQYSDFLCPSCSYVSTHIMPDIIKTYVDTGKVNFEFRPMAFIAPGSQTADEGAYCAVDQGKFWQYHDSMYTYVWDNAFSKGVDPKSTTILTADIVKTVAHDAGLESAAFDSCLDKGTYAQKVQTTTATAQSQGVNSTPYLMVNGQAIRGEMTASAIKAMIKTQL